MVKYNSTSFWGEPTYIFEDKILFWRYLRYEDADIILFVSNGGFFIVNGKSM